MAYPATKRYNYFGQLGILAGLVGGGLVFGSIITYVLILLKTGVSGASAAEVMDNLFVPENAEILRIVQFISTFFLFFYPLFFTR